LEGHVPAFLKTTVRSGGTTISMEVYSPEPVTLVLNVAEVSSGAVLKTWLDGHEGPAWTFDPKPGSGDTYLSTHKDPKWNVDVGTYQKECTLPIPKDRHRLRLENQGADWLRLGSATMAGIHPPVQVKLYGLSSDNTVVGWVQDKRDLWRNVYDKGWNPVPVKDIVFPLPHLTSGIWSLTWWDTHTGETTSGGPLTLRNGKMDLQVPDFKGDIAFTLTRFLKP
jgi:hypothetical protein